MINCIKKNLVVSWAAVALLLILNLCLLNGAQADDIDIFQAANTTVDRPNVLIILDTSSNWNSRFSEEKSALASVVNSLTDRFNVGLMMYSTRGGSDLDSGGVVRFRVQQMTVANKAAIVTRVNALDRTEDAANNSSPSMIMNEAYRYFAGTNVWSHNRESAMKRDSSAATGSIYNSPIILGSCAKNYIIYISNGPGDPNQRVSDARNQLANFGGNATPVIADGTESVADLYARFMYLKDPPPPPIPSFYRPFRNFPGANVITYTVEIDPANSTTAQRFTRLLKSTANQGDGKYYAVIPGAGSVTNSLINALNSIFKEIQAVNNTFASAALPASAGVQGIFLNQVYMGVFRPAEQLSPLWIGNLKQYQFRFDESTRRLFLADVAGTPVESPNTGFVQPNAISFWTKDSSFWNFKSEFFLANGNGSSSTTCPTGGPASDCPDGPWVEKGGVAQRLRTVYPGTTATNSPVNRPIYICNTAGGACTAGSPLITLLGSLDCNSSIVRGALGVSDAAACINLRRWIFGEDNRVVNGSLDENENNIFTDIRASVHGDVLHSQPAVIDYGGSTGVWAFYGSNDGIFHAVKGGQESCMASTTTTCSGTEQWGFIPYEFYDRLNRLREQSPLINMPSVPGNSSNKSYFMDGPIGSYRSGNTVYIFPTMRRGGRSIYALDVSTPSAPRILWHKSNSDTGFGELGQTWSKPVLERLGASSSVLVFGAGYDAPVEDGVTGATPSMGRGVFIVNVADGSIIKAFGPSDGIAHSIPGNVTPVDTNGDGYSDRFYAADTGGNIWRIKYDATNITNPWSIFRLAALGGTGADARKFLFGPDVFPYEKGSSKYGIVIGSGDREKPLDRTITNRFYMLLDDGSDSLITEGGTPPVLADASSGSVTLTSSQKGWFITLASGEKVTGEAIVVAGRVVFGTNRPTPTVGATYPGTSYPICTGNLGEARRYAINYRTAGGTDVLANTPNSRFQVTVGGGFLPSPTAGVVQITREDGTVESHVFIMDNPANPGGVMKVNVELDPIRNRIYWYKENID